MQKIGLYMCNQKNGTVQVRNFVFLYINNTYIARRDLNHAILIEWYSTGGGGGGSWISQYPLNLISFQLFTFWQFLTDWNVQFYLWIKYILRVYIISDSENVWI